MKCFEIEHKFVRLLAIKLLYNLMFWYFKTESENANPLYVD